jgi:benzodiazapine receptor
MKKYRPLVIFFVIPMAIGLWAANFTIDAMQSFMLVKKPAYTPPAGTIPIIILVVFILMGISAFLVYKSKSFGRETPLYIWALQLVFCFFWAITFFGGGAYQLSLVWLIVLWILIAVMIVRFYRFRQVAGYLQIPYLICATFAGYLNFMVYMLNR